MDATFAISRNGFTFRDGQLYVDVDGHLHTREDAANLYVLLISAPAAPPAKPGKESKKAAHADREAHFYTAQLVHYGFKPLKTREPAKKRLLAAFGGPNGKTLEVPEAILELEETLSREWHERSSKSTANKEIAHKSKKRKIEATNLKEDEGPGPRTTAKAAALKTKTLPQIRKAIATLSEENARKILTKLLDELPAVQTVLSAELTSLSTKNTVPSGKRTTKASSSSSKKATPLDPAEWTGIYKITAAELEEQWPDVTEAMTLEIYPSSTSAHIWASFDFGIIAGVMRSTEPPPDSLKVGIPFQWRGRETGENAMTFDKSNRGDLAFLGGGKVEGSMDGHTYCGMFRFSGVLQTRGGKVVPGKLEKRQHQEVKKWKEEWRSINGINYEVENTSRWGRWGGEEKQESAFESDTTVGHHRRDQDRDENHSYGGSEDEDESEYHSDDDGVW
ncbi:hypothetical protein BDZ97DRAFT_1923668 [Flammula alnicola]|nr:hypothetical protein BDZ97DRAFT_1923668 [Flammula alnicola]